MAGASWQVALLCSCIIALCCAQESQEVELFMWVSANGTDGPSCGAVNSPCKTLNYIATTVYSRANLSVVQVTLQTGLAYEEFEIITDLEPVKMLIVGENFAIVNSSITIPEVEYRNINLVSSFISGLLVSFYDCSLYNSKLHFSLPVEGQHSFLTLQSCVLENCKATFYTLNVSASRFINSPIATTPDGDCIIVQSNFTGCVGAAALSFGTCNVYDSIFAGNQGVFGGAISVAIFTHIVTSLIYNNTAQRGGGIYSLGIVSLDNSVISNNAASEAGGGLYFEGAEGVLACDASYISYNHAGTGGGIMIKSEVFYSNNDEMNELCVLQGNMVDARGGGLYAENSRVSLQSIFLSDNDAIHAGGIYCLNCSLTLSYVVVFSNEGGGMYAENSVVIINFSSFGNNSYGSPSADMTLQNSSSSITSWDQVTVSSSAALVCNDCHGKFCTALTSCKDCENGCITMGTEAVCVEEYFWCGGHGECREMAAKEPKCTCDANYSGAQCHIRTPPEWGTIAIVGFTVGCLLVLVVVIAAILRFHKRRTGYQPLKR